MTSPRFFCYPQGAARCGEKSSGHEKGSGEVFRIRSALVSKGVRDLMGKKLFVGGISWNTSEDGLRQAFERACSYVDHLPTSDVPKILGGTAARLFRFAEDPS